jgi:hypothetical protein
MSCVVLIHIGKHLPEYIYDAVYQTLLINGSSCKLYIILDDTLITSFLTRCSEFNLDVVFKTPFDYMNVIQPIPISILQNYLNAQPDFLSYLSIIQKHNVSSFRDGFWISTTARFYYIQAFMTLFKVSNVFHIENDIVMYETFNNIYTYITNEHKADSNSTIWMVQDSHDRVVPSILFFPSSSLLLTLTTFITQSLEYSNCFLNDMNILGQFQPKLPLPLFCDKKIMFDGAAIGQYLGGIDLRNNHDKSIELKDYYQNKTRGFINEISQFKPNTCVFSKTTIQTNEHSYPLKMILCKNENNNISLVANIHIHSKQLYQFSSVFTTNFDDIITGDRILTLCDFVIVTNEIYNFHKGIQNFANEIILVKDWNNVNIKLMNSFFSEFISKTKKKVVKLFVYTHIADHFQKHIVSKLDPNIDFVLYFHNSDHSFNTKHSPILNLENIKHVYAQNIDHPCHNKLTLLPIGLANSMWNHGDLVGLYTVMRKVYSLSKSQNIYVNINPTTFPYRQNLLDYIKKHNTFTISTSKPYNEYLNELAQHRFCLCIRGNGIDTHRFWEALYLGVIPVIIDNQHTNCKFFIEHIKTLNVPFVMIDKDNTQEIFKTYNESFFNHDKYIQILKKSHFYIFSLPCLQLSFYESV